MYKGVVGSSEHALYTVVNHDSIYDMAESFFLQLLNVSEQRLVIAIGFDSCLGSDSSLERLIRTYDQEARFQFKNGVESQMCKFT